MRLIELSHGHLLGGRVRYAQPVDGFRSGIEPVLLAASIPARKSEHVLEAGAGAGAGLLCLAAREPAIAGTGVECEPGLAELAARNAADNGFARLAFVVARVEAMPAEALFDHAFANPPYHADSGTAATDADRRRAKHAPPYLIDAWTTALATRLRPRGTLTLIVPAGLLDRCVQAFVASGCGSLRLLPLWPREGRPAKLVLLRAVKGGRGPSQVHPGLVLHRPDGGFTDAADSVLREGAALVF